MSNLIKQVSIGLLSFSESLVTKCVSLNNEPCINRTTLIDLNPIELNPLIISLDKRNGSCNAVGDLSTKIGMKLSFEKISTQNYAEISL